MTVTQRNRRGLNSSWMKNDHVVPNALSSVEQKTCYFEEHWLALGLSGPGKKQEKVLKCLHDVSHVIWHWHVQTSFSRCRWMISGFHVPRERSPSLYNHIRERTETPAADPPRRRLDPQTPEPRPITCERLAQSAAASVSHTHTHTVKLQCVPVFVTLSLIISECSAVCHSG